MSSLRGRVSRGWVKVEGETLAEKLEEEVIDLSKTCSNCKNANLKMTYWPCNSCKVGVTHSRWEAAQ